MKISLYGSVPIPKAYCQECKTEAFVIDSKLACCDKEMKEGLVDKVKRESQAEKYRVSNELKEKVLKLQEYRCYLCGCQLNQKLWYQKKGEWHRVKTEFDHFIPRAFCSTNHLENIYAMCHLCNGTKGSKIFDNRDDAIEYVMERRKEKGTIDLFNQFEREALNEK